MAEGCLPDCPIFDDVVSYRPSGDAARASWLLAGFPCQGVSQAGQQGGLRDGRSNLVREAFNTFDRLPQGQGMLLENVGALLSTQKECRGVFCYIQKVPASS
ncbi:Modification methylase ScrFIA [Durusdinium trenchii]|uniref:Modification methylase ScrFIA n=1 Tax=Durusdinium trenchii TaxID=1381693 RepID=A0ABP0QJ01_9DINO